ncbi:MAG: divergent PAP2 family protein, partial [Nanoarchaeota archaeon]
IDSVHAKRFLWRSFFQPGGMPSSHSALVSSLVTAVGFTEGLESTLFIVTLVFALIVMYDAFGHHNIKRHTPWQVVAGTLIGIATIVLAAR